MISQTLLDRWNILISAEEILILWNEPHRKYHSASHLQDLFTQIDRLADIFDKERDILQLAAIFHDIVYEPWRNDNEQQSAAFLQKHAPQNDDIQQIVNIILDTQHHDAKTPLSRIFCGLDMSVVESSYETLLQWEDGIYFEYSFLPLETYIQRRVEFLQRMCEKFPHNSHNLIRLIERVQTLWENYDIVLEYEQVENQNT